MGYSSLTILKTILKYSGGGVMTPALAEQFSARLAASGIAAGAIASRHIARLAAGLCLFAALGLSGCGGGNYCPTSPVTREQMAVFLSATFGLRLY